MFTQGGMYMSGQLGSALAPYLSQAYRSGWPSSAGKEARVQGQPSNPMYWNQQPRVAPNMGTPTTGIAPFSGPGGTTNQGVLPGFINAFGMRGSPPPGPDVWGRTWYQDPKIGRRVFGVAPSSVPRDSIGAPGGSTDFDESTGLYRSTGTPNPPNTIGSTPYFQNIRQEPAAPTRQTWPAVPGSGGGYLSAPSGDQPQQAGQQYDAMGQPGRNAGGLPMTAQQLQALAQGGGQSLQGFLPGYGTNPQPPYPAPAGYGWVEGAGPQGQSRQPTLQRLGTGTGITPSGSGPSQGVASYGYDSLGQQSPPQQGNWQGYSGYAGATPFTTTPRSQGYQGPVPPSMRASQGGK